MNRPYLDADQVIDFKRYYAYGFVINLIPLYIFYPVRTGKTLQQANIGTGFSTSLFSVIAERTRTEGVRGLYKGLGVYAFGSISGRLVHFATYDALRERVYKGRGSSLGLGWLEGRDPAIINGFLGTLASVTTSSFMVPFDMISHQLQVSKKDPSVNNIQHPESLNINNKNQPINENSTFPKRNIHTINHIKQFTFGILSTAHEKATKTPTKSSIFPSIKLRDNFITRLKPHDVPWYRFLYRGWSAGILSTISFFPVYFYTYTFTLQHLERNQHFFTFLPSQHFFLSVSAGMVAGLSATFASAPFDVVKTRIQIAREAGHNNMRWLAMAGSILRTQGLRGMFVGMSARLSIIVPLGSLNFWVFEKVREWSAVRIELPPSSDH
ncbi:hypothetical protein G9A89_017506 [Geosiphon pyriformis]|nr:hypothetical protein G9A89_017506 [Geosiphon pyriformis]